MKDAALSDQLKGIFDGVSICSVLAALAGYLPTVAAVASLVWTLIRIYETRTVQKWLRR